MEIKIGLKKCWGSNNFRVKIYFIDASLYTKFPTVFISIVSVKVVTDINKHKIDA